LRRAALPQTGGVETNRHSTLRERLRGKHDETENQRECAQEQSQIAALVRPRS
jgi:hypothetical protein